MKVIYVLCVVDLAWAFIFLVHRLHAGKCVMIVGLLVGSFVVLLQKLLGQFVS